MNYCLPNWKDSSSENGCNSNRAKKQKSFLFLFFSFLSCSLFAQTSITGKVTSGDSALSGVTVQVKGVPTTTQTDVNGAFSIRASANATLVFSYVGYNQQELKVNSRTTLNVQMESLNQQLTDVVVVGYSTQKRATVTGAVSSINSKDLVTTPANTTSGALVGKVQGITTRAPDSRPGRGVNIQIRNMGNPL